MPRLVRATCVAGPTPELVDARRAYEQARHSQAPAYSPDKLLSAKQALDRAEAAHAEDPGSFREQSLSYVAERRANLAAVYGDYEKDQRDRATAHDRYREREDDLRQRAEQRARETGSSLEAARQEIAAQSSALKTSQSDLGQERQAREKAEKRAAAAIASLSKVAQVKEEARGTVITLEGAVLFVTGKSELLPIAKQKLDDVARALKDMGDDKLAQIEGYTDSRGADDMNLKLSQDRADAVRQYLISQGVKPEQLKAVGRGEQSPVASNDTAEGRANNRRVEIVIQPKSATASAPAHDSSDTPAEDHH